MSTIAIVGAGMMGSAMSFPATDNGHEVRLIGTPLDRDIIEHAARTGEHPTLRRRLPAGIGYHHIEALADAIEGAHLLICGVSSFGVDWFAESVLPLVPPELPVLAVTKGMFDMPDGRLIPYPAHYEELTGGRLSLNAVGGPCTSYELADRDQTHVTFCGRDIGTLRRIRVMLETGYYHISLSTDVTGVECAVAMKNAYALGVTLAVGLSERLEGVGGTQHYNSQAALFGQSIREMRRLLRLTGGHDDNIMLGAGDLYVTVFGGRTRRIGTLLGRGVPFAQAMEELGGITLESVVIATRTARAVRALIARGQATPGEFPLLLHIDEILNRGAAVDIPWDQFETEYVAADDAGE